jgi:hypothetical protein
MGAYQSFIQAITAGVKLAVLFNLTLLICFPAFFIVQFILGSRLKLHQMISIIISGVRADGVDYAVVHANRDNLFINWQQYYFLHLLHVAIFVVRRDFWDEHNRAGR